MSTMRRPRFSAAIVLGPLLLLAGCAYYDTPNGGKVLGTAPLTWTFPTSPQSPANALAAPPGSSMAAFGTAASLPPPAADLSGTYSGTADGTYNPGTALDCGDIAINRSFVVTGRQVRFFSFTGTIGANGRIVMQAGDKWLNGRFIGRSFEGELLRRYPACSWSLRLVAN